MTENPDQAPPRPKRLTRAEAKARTRELLLDAASEVFASKGLAGASVEEIAERAGFSIGALYSNFSGKEELFLELMAHRASERVADTAQLLTEGRGQEQGLARQPWQALGQQMIDTADKNMDLAPLQAEFWLYAVRHPAAMGAFAARVRKRREPLERLLAGEFDHEGGVYPDDLPARVAIVISALFQGMVRQRRIDPENVPPELYGDALCWLFTGIRTIEAGKNE
jgi:AcrR family transcriptional regulator